MNDMSGNECFSCREHISDCDCEDHRAFVKKEDEEKAEAIVFFEKVGIDVLDKHRRNGQGLGLLDLHIDADNLLKWLKSEGY